MKNKDSQLITEAYVSLVNNPGKPVRASTGSNEGDVENAARQPFTALDHALNSGHHPRLWSAVKGSPFEKQYIQTVLKGKHPEHPVVESYMTANARKSGMAQDAAVKNKQVALRKQQINDRISEIFRMFKLQPPMGEDALHQGIFYINKSHPVYAKELQTLTAELTETEKSPEVFV